jgi:glycine cleavage system aminomethyltransferase T
MELGGWERAHGYAANEHLLKKYGNRVPVRENEWDNRHFWRVSNAEHLAMSEDCGIVNLSHFYMFDVEGPDHVALMEWICAAKIGGEPNIGKGIYTHFLDDEGMVRADLDGVPHGRSLPRGRRRRRRPARPALRAAAGCRTKGFNVTVTDVSEKYVTIGIWGPNAAHHAAEVVEDPNGLAHENFPFASIKPIKIAGKTSPAFRISYVGEQGWELHMSYEDGLAVWDALRATGVMAVRRRDLRQQPPHGKEPAPAERRPADRIQPARSRPAAPEGQGRRLPRQGQHLEHRAAKHQPAMLCTLVMTGNTDSKGVARYPVGTMPVMDPETKETLVDELGRRSFTTSVAYGPTIGKNIALAYLPWSYCQEGRKLLVEYFGETYPSRSPASATSRSMIRRILKPRT